ncbi:MAG: HIT domain-containing protein [Verrucomicrobia bacterium]|nr:HIT domain-containing protein [Verrucomicrobiota bacterium]
MKATAGIYFEDDYIRVQDPQVPLAPGALEIDVKQDDEQTYERIYDVYRKLQNYWSPSLAIGRYYLERLDAKTGVILRQIIPFPKVGLGSKLRQIQVTWNLLFPHRAYTEQKTLGAREDLRELLQSPDLLELPVVTEGKDAFCKPDRIEAQQVQEGTTTHLLYNFKPITENDFLIVSKEHTSDFTKEAFVEAMKTGSKVNRVYAKKGFSIGYITFADHPAAGQTVPHPHVHVTNVKTRADELWGVAKVVRKICFDSWAQYILPSWLFQLSDKQLVPIIAARRQDLAEALQSK